MSDYTNSRRKFIRQASIATMGYTTLFSTIFNMRTINAAARMNSSVQDESNYKAMVCLFFSGGMDSFNVLIPRGTPEYAEYATTRSNLAIAQNELLDINPIVSDGKAYGIHPNMPEVKTLFEQGRLSFISNIGSLVTPTTKAGYEDGSTPLPLGLYSHADLIKHWQTGIPSIRTSVGWGGKLADMMSDANSNVNIPMNLALSGSNVFQTGNESVEFTLNIYSDSGVSGIPYYHEDWGINPMAKMAIDNMLEADYTDAFQKTYIDVAKSARDGSEELSQALAAVPGFSTTFDQTSDLSKAFQLVAKVIAARESLGMTRQIFFIDYGGWDHHDNLIPELENMLPDVSNALGEFNAVLEELDMLENVTTFSASEFGRTLTSNGNGSDHAWGGNAFVMGGSVIGKHLFGSFPSLELNNPLEVGGGVMIPTTSTDEYFAELALWFGVPSTELVTLFPNLGNFYDVNSGSAPIGFLQT